MGDDLVDLLDLSRADITTKRPEKKRRGLQQISELGERVRAVQEADAKQPPLPSGIGDEIMKAFGIPPSRKIGEIKRALDEAVFAGEVPAHECAETYIAFLRENAGRFGV
jgi:poly(A) polymerase